MLPLIWLCVFASLSGVVSALPVLYPEMELGRDALGWEPDLLPRIEESEKCRRRPPKSGGLFYVVGFVRGGNGNHTCHYVVFDYMNIDGVELKMLRNNKEAPIWDCRPVPDVEGQENCPMTPITQNYFTIYCGVDGDPQSLDLKLVEIKAKTSSDSYSPYYLMERNIGSRVWWPFNITSKDLMIAHYLDWGDVAILLGSDPPWALEFGKGRRNGIVSLLENKTDPSRWFCKGRLKFSDYETDPIAYFDSRQIMYRLWFPYDCNYTADSGDFCEYLLQRGSIAIYKIDGAFNQYACLRVRRGQVHYDVTTQLSTGVNADDPYGFIVEKFNETTGEILNQKCFYSPEFSGTYGVPVNLIPRRWEEMEDFCANRLEPEPIKPKPRDFGDKCQTAVINPKNPKDVRQLIIGMEPSTWAMKRTAHRGDVGLPLLTAYSGILEEPIARIYPKELQENCYIEENRESTAMTHFGIRWLNEMGDELIGPTFESLLTKYFVVFCNRNYGKLKNASPVNGTSVYLYRAQYDKRRTFDGMVLDLGNIELITSQQLQVNTQTVEYLDNRGVMMMPMGREMYSGYDGLFPTMYHFVQMKPCVFFSLDMAVVDKKFKVRPPNSSPNQVCTEADLVLTHPDDFNEEPKRNFSDLMDCIHRSCFVSDHETFKIEKGDKYEPENYFTSDIVRTQSRISFGGVRCTRSSFHYVLEKGKPAYVYKFESATWKEKSICFMPYNRSSNFQIYFDASCDARDYDYLQPSNITQVATEPPPFSELPFVGVSRTRKLTTVITTTTETTTPMDNTTFDITTEPLTASGTDPEPVNTSEAATVTETLSTTETQSGSTNNGLPDAEALTACKGHFIDTMAGVGLAAGLLILSALVFASVFLIAGLGNRRDTSAKTPAATPGATSAQRETPAVTPVTPAQKEETPMKSVVRSPRSAMSAAKSSDATKSAYNVFSNIGDFALPKSAMAPVKTPAKEPKTPAKEPKTPAKEAAKDVQPIELDEESDSSTDREGSKPQTPAAEASRRGNDSKVGSKLDQWPANPSRKDGKSQKNLSDYRKL